MCFAKRCLWYLFKQFKIYMRRHNAYSIRNLYLNSQMWLETRMGIACWACCRLNFFALALARTDFYR